MKKYFSGLTKDTFLLAFVSFFADVSTEMLYPILPIFLTQNLKSGGSIVGLIEGIATATQYIIQGFSGWLSDKFQKRKSIALVGYSLSAISKPFIGFAITWPEVLLARFLDRLGSGTRSAPRDALVASSTDEKNKGKAFGLEGIGDNLGAFLGPLIAIFLLFSLHIDIRNIFYLAFIPAILAVIMASLVREKVATIDKSRIKITFKNFPKSYWKYLLVTAIFGLGNSSNAFLILQTRDAGVSLQLTILIYAFYNLVAALTSYPSGFLSDIWGRKNILLFSFIIFILTYLGFALSKNVLILAVLFILYGLYQGIFRSVGKALATDLVPSSLRASGVGWYSTTIGLSGLIASIVAGVLWDQVSHPAVFIYGSIFAFFGSAALLIFNPINKANSQKA